MHFWIDKRATSCHYGRRRPNFHNGALATSFGRTRRSRSHSNPDRGMPSSSLTPSTTTASGRRGSTDSFTTRHYHYTSRFQVQPSQGSRVASSSSLPRRSSSATAYRPIPDPAIRRALEELDAELRLTFPSSPSASDRTSNCFNSKQLGLCFCFLGFVLLCTVAGKFIVEGPAIIDASRRPLLPNMSEPKSSPSVTFFFATEVIFVAFALGLFFAGVSCLRKRTNEYLMRQFRQHIINSRRESEIERGGTQSIRSSGATLISMSEEEGTGSPGEPEGSSLFLAGGRRESRNQRRGSRFTLDTEVNGGQSGRNRRCYNYAYGCQQLLQSMQKPPPYDVALYLPRPNQQRPHHTSNIPATVTVSNFTEATSEDDIEKFACVVSPSPSRTETPPPSYHLQFSFEI